MNINGGDWLKQVNLISFYAFTPHKDIFNTFT